MKKLLLVVCIGFGAVAIGGGVYSRLDAVEPTVTYYGDGQPKSSFRYADGLKDGASVEWHPDGTKACEGDYRGGFREGPWSFWREDGSLDVERSGEYRQGSKVDES
jgi:antitoxin component YwqK of YwqJK toxin-antitoxin module